MIIASDVLNIVVIRCISPSCFTWNACYENQCKNVIKISSAKEARQGSYSAIFTNYLYFPARILEGLYLNFPKMRISKLFRMTIREGGANETNHFNPENIGSYVCS